MIPDAASGCPETANDPLTGLIQAIALTASQVCGGEGPIAVIDKDEQLARTLPFKTIRLYEGYHAPNDLDAIERLERARQDGARALLIPSYAFWWLAYYRDFQAHLETRYPCIWEDPHCIIVALEDDLARLDLVRSQHRGSFGRVLDGIAEVARGTWPPSEWQWLDRIHALQTAFADAHGAPGAPAFPFQYVAGSANAISAHGAALFKVVRHLKPLSVLQVGADAAVAAHLGAALSLNAEGHLTAIVPPGHPEEAALLRSLVTAAGLTQIAFHEAGAGALASLATLLDPVHLLVLNGIDGASATIAMFERMIGLLPDGAAIALTSVDESAWSHVETHERITHTASLGGLAIAVTGQPHLSKRRVCLPRLGGFAPARWRPPVPPAVALRQFPVSAPKSHLPAKGPTTPVSGARFTLPHLRSRLWGGFSAPALSDLECLCRSEARPSGVRIEAAWELARWHAVLGDFRKTQGYLETMRELDPKEELSQRFVMLAIRARLELGDVASASALLDRACARYAHATDLCLLASNVAARQAHANGASADSRRLDLVNALFRERGLQPLRRLDPNAALSFQNVTSVPEHYRLAARGPLVSVIMTAYNAARTIEVALASVLSQSWQDIELVVVDDASTDETRRLVHAIASRDHRVVMVSSPRNIGAFAARNVGLAHARGEFVMAHDADDWSHSQRIELQLAPLLAEDYPASTSSCVRTTWDMTFNGPWRPGRGLIETNMSSLMLRTASVRDLGGWDTVRFEADTEFQQRLQRAGQWPPARVLPAVPLSLVLEHNASLTRHPATHIRHVGFGMWNDYREAYARWHKTATAPQALRLESTPERPRTFPAPAVMLSRPKKRQEFDVVFVSDFALEDGGSFISNHQYMVAALRASLRVGAFHWRYYSRSASRALNEPFTRLVDTSSITQISAEEAVRTTHLILYYPPAFQFLIDRVPKIAFDHMYTVVNQMASSMEGGELPSYDPITIRDNLKARFGAEGEWFPISPRVRDLMHGDARYPKPGNVTWTPLLDTGQWCQRPIVWRRDARRTPVIGRHGRDHATKWPSTRDALEHAYCIPSGWETRILGGADHASRVLGGRLPDSWHVWRFNELDVASFLSDLDFFLHFPHESYIEEFGRVVMEAMAMGIPAVLPPRFTTTFGDAAVYCEPSAVQDAIKELWRDGDRYLELAARGREFVLRHCALQVFPKRLKAPRRLRRVRSNGPSAVHDQAFATARSGQGS